MKHKLNSARYVYTEILMSEFNPGMEFELITSAKQYDSRYGEFQYSKQELEEMAWNFNNDVVGTEIAVDLNHDEEGIALAWIQPGSMSVRPSTKLAGHYSLYARLYRYTPKGEELVSTGAVRYFSIELQFKFEKVVEGKKKTYRNVIRGVALTNRPVIKDMAPTFSEKYINNQNTMDELKKLFSSLAAKDSITQDEYKKFQEAAAEAVEADEAVKDEAEKMEAELEPKVEEAEGDSEAEKELAENKAKELAENAVKKVLSEFNGKKVDVAALTEKAVKEALKGPLQQLNSLLAETRTNRLSEQVNSLMLSEKNAVGFKADSKSKVLAFVKKLSDDLAQEYFELHEGIISGIDLSEKGEDSDFDSAMKIDVYAELDKETKAYAKEHGVDEAAAQKAVLLQNKELAERIEKQEQKLREKAGY